jgi:hypothetical protein
MAKSPLGKACSGSKPGLLPLTASVSARLVCLSPYIRMRVLLEGCPRIHPYSSWSSFERQFVEEVTGERGQGICNRSAVGEGRCLELAGAGAGQSGWR